jgi:hypothetical protein
MPRPVPQNTEPVNGDSFLDIVASVVSIMIIMVVMVGMKIKNAPVRVEIPAGPATRALEKDLAAEQSLRSDIIKMSEEIRGIKEEAVARGMQRNLMASMVSAAEHEIQQRRQKLDGAKQADFDLTRGISEAHFQLDQLGRQRQEAENATGAPVVVESYPTPISHVVDGPEAHLMITHGRVVFVPMQALVEELKAQARRQAYKLTASDSELSDTIGPIDGFRIRYTLERHDIQAQGRHEIGGGAYVNLQKFTLMPIADDLGEPVRLALEQNSDFRQTLSKMLPGRTAITIWVYPDGFDAFRQIRKELYRLGYMIAARPLPEGTPIGGSPEGSKSAAQ